MGRFEALLPAGCLVIASLTGALTALATEEPRATSPGSDPPGQRSGMERERPAGGRLLPPSTLPCTRDHLTAFNGRIVVYKRSPERVVLKMRTDESTTESFTLALSKGEDPAARFLLEGEPFGPEAWARVESGPGRVREGMRAIVWMCRENPKQLLIDWRPGEAPSSAGAPPK